MSVTAFSLKYSNTLIDVIADQLFSPAKIKAGNVKNDVSMCFMVVFLALRSFIANIKQLK